MNFALSSTRAPLAINMNQPGSFLHWSIFYVSVANLVLIAVMVVIFGAALLLPFPRGHRQVPAALAGEAPDGATGNGAASASEPADDGAAGMWTARVRSRAVRTLPPGQAAARPPARLRGVLGVRVRRRPAWPRLAVVIASGCRPGPRRSGLVALQPGRALLQQPAPVERRAVHGLAGHPPVGQVLDGRLARPAGPDLDHRRGRVRGLGRGVLHRLPVPAELRLPVDLHQRQGRLQRRRRRRVLQRDELRPDADVAHRAHPVVLVAIVGAHVLLVRVRGVSPPADTDAADAGAGRLAGAPSRRPSAAEWRGPTGATTS